MSFNRTPVLAAAVLVAWLLQPNGAHAQECSDCHDVKVAATSVHAEVGCAECHADIDLEAHMEGEMMPATGDQVCANCHDVGEALSGSVHADQVGCQACHGPGHEVRALEDPENPVAKVRQLGTCGECHSEVSEAYLESVHGRGLVMGGLVVAPTCSDCHGSHQILTPSDPESRVSFKNVPTTCGECHVGVLRTWRSESAHGVAWGEGREDAPTCVTCHSSHSVVEPDARTPRVESPETCGNCHEAALVSYRESFHGRAAHLGFESAAICADCHSPHANLPASDPRSTVHPDNLQATCGNCHQGITESFTSFISHADYHDKEKSPTLYWAFIFMTGLLLMTFGAFGIHALLWFQRSIVALIRGEEHHEIDTSGPWVKRFSQGSRWIHLTIILTFLTLAATGLPLKFHWTAWAQWLADYPGIISVTRFLHRLAAVFTFGYAFAHLGQLFYKFFVKKQRGMLFGPDSLVPRLQDLRDATAMIQYFLYVRPKPKLDRWTYWEKFDYFAVFWGIPVIGISGLMLWFPEWFTGWLPGWSLNLAFLIHSDEALLATGFIFVFHFFHTHVRPEAFPLDPVMFTGSMPLERFREERPLEYQRLVDAGKLEEMLVDPPSTFQLRTIYAFGFVAVTTGVALAIGIIWGLLTW